MSFRNTKTPSKPTTPAKWQVPMRPNPTSGMKEYYLEGELKERFCKLFPKNSNRRMMAWFGIGFSTMQRFKREFGLEKDMQAIRKQQAKDIKKICERNGYYDSIRGKAPSEACLEATRQLRASGFHPMKQLKAKFTLEALHGGEADAEPCHHAAVGVLGEELAETLLQFTFQVILLRATFRFLSHGHLPLGWSGGF